MHLISGGAGGGICCYSMFPVSFVNITEQDFECFCMTIECSHRTVSLETTVLCIYCISTVHFASAVDVISLRCAPTQLAALQPTHRSEIRGGSTLANNTKWRTNTAANVELSGGRLSLHTHTLRGMLTCKGVQRGRSLHGVFFVKVLYSVTKQKTNLYLSWEVLVLTGLCFRCSGLSGIEKTAVM